MYFLGVLFKRSAKDPSPGGCHRPLRAHAETVTASAQRMDDWNFAYHVRPVVIDLGEQRQTISPLDAQLLLGELARLPTARHRTAAATAESIICGLTRACAVSLDEDDQRTVLRAVEGVRARRRLSCGLGSLRALLVHLLAEPVV